MVFAREPLFFVQVNQFGLETVGNQKKGQGAHSGKEEKRYKEFPLQAYIVQSVQMQGRHPSLLISCHISPANMANRQKTIKKPFSSQIYQLLLVLLFWAVDLGIAGPTVP
jgi:hypothetical protein